ncbi:MAG: 50S ribosomal protein L11 methyltransferase [Nitrospirae bacterium]|nr:50S ribosomal protein L11 methyltransferase [Nitrospirota bacterium]
MTTELDAGELLSRLEDPDVTGAWEQEGAVRLYWPADKWNGDVLAHLKTVVTDPAAVAPHVLVQSIPAQDWNAIWAQSVAPIRIGRRIIVRPSWAPAESAPGDIELILDPKQAFGTGHHATTQLLIEWLEERIQGREGVLDIGTGSGLLAMVALRLGAETAIGFDIDPVAIECARDYGAMNKFGPELSLCIGDLGFVQEIPATTIDLIVANLDRRTLLEAVNVLAPFLDRGAVLLVSGLLRADRDEIAQAYAAVGASVGQVREREGWLAMELLKAEPCEGSDR